MFRNIFIFREIYHKTIYAIILICVHRTVEPFVLYFICHFQYSYQREYCLYSMYYISYFPTLRGNHSVFVITIQKCKFSTFKFALLQFDLYHQYLYSLLIFSFCEICDSEQYRAIVGNSPTPV